MLCYTHSTSINFQKRMHCNHVCLFLRRMCTRSDATSRNENERDLGPCITSHSLHPIVCLNDDRVADLSSIPTGVGWNHMPHRET